MKQNRVSPAKAGAQFSLAVISAVLAGCITPPGHVKFDPQAPSAMYVQPPQYAQPPAAANGAIFQAATYRPLFEDNRARRAGDTLTINLVEKTSASRKASSTTNRDANASASIASNIAKLPLKGLGGLNFEGESGSKFNGKGETASDALLTGVITVTVQHVLPNGNLYVAGEKQVGVNSNVERIRLAGVVNPTTIMSGNMVNSTQVADARIELSGSGLVDETQTMGWLQRFFMSVWPI